MEIGGKVKYANAGVISDTDNKKHHVVVSLTERL